MQPAGFGQAHAHAHALAQYAQPQAAPQYPQTHHSFGQAQTALASAGGMMKVTKYSLLGVGGLCILGGAVMLLAVDPMSGVMMAVTGGVLIGVALRVLPQFSGMLGQASAMVDGLAAKEHLARTGVPARGRLLGVQQTGRLVNFDPEIQVTIEVHHPRLGVYQTQSTALVPQMAIPRAQPGAEVHVRVNPQNQHDVALVF